MDQMGYGMIEFHYLGISWIKIMLTTSKWFLFCNVLIGQIIIIHNIIYNYYKYEAAMGVILDNICDFNKVMNIIYFN